MDTELMSKRAYAKYLGVNEKAIRKAINEGKIKTGWDAFNQQIIRSLADEEYGFMHLVPKAGPGIGKEKVVEKLNKKPAPAAAGKVRTKGTVSPRENKEVRTSAPSAENQRILPANDNRDLARLEKTELLELLKLTADMSYKDAVTANAIIEAALKKKELEELEDVLVRRVNVEAALFAFGSQLRKALLAIPARVTDDIMNAGNKVEAMNILNQELVNTLDQYSDMERIKLSNKS